MKRLLFILVFLCCSFFSCFCYANENQDTQNILNQYFQKDEFNDVDKVFRESEYGKNFNFGETVQKFISGDIDLSPKAVFQYFIKTVFKEVYENLEFIRNIILICVLSAFIRCLVQSLKNKEIGELSFYVTYIVMVISLFSSFSLSISIMYNTVQTISELMKASIPLIIGILVMSGGSAGAYLFSSVIFSASEFIMLFIENFAMPLIIVSSIMQIINYLSEREILSKFSELLKNCVSWGVKGSAIIFMGILSLQRAGAVGGNTLINKTAKFAVNMLPVVGDVFSGTIESFSAFSGVIRTGIGTAFILGVIVFCAIPIIKIVAIIFIYKLTASIIQPICDRRIVNCIDDMGKYTGVILSIIIMSVVVFIFALILVISISGG